MTKRAYRLLPLDEEGNPRESSQYVLVRAEPVQIGDQIDAGTAICKELRP